MMSFSLADRPVVGCVSCVVAPGDIDDTGPLEVMAAVLADRTVVVSLRLESVTTPPTPCGSGGPVDLTLGSRDHLHERAARLAEYSTPLRSAAVFQGHEGGSDSPPQVGGGPIDSYTALGVDLSRT